VKFTDKIRQIIDQLREKHKLSFVNDTTYHEKWSLKVSSLTLISLWVMYTLIIVLAVMLLARYTGLSAVIQDSDNAETKEMIEEQERAIDSLYALTSSNDKYLDNLLRLLNDEDFNDSISLRPQDSSFVNYTPDFTRSKEDSILREKLQNQQEHPNENITGYTFDFFFPPVNGVISQSFNPSKQHYGTDIATAADEPIKSCLDGTVILSGWVPGEGNILVIQHKNEFISIYKHCSVLLKKQGDHVTIGDPVGIVGNTGENSSGPHLHFELWQNTIALNPQEYISF
jgi:murein DD-endopeptidase MepM/ murein hydrolase activator NlpD